MSENEMIWRATDADGQCYEYRSQPKKELGNFYSQPGTQSADYFGHEKPPPGECWEMTVTRKGDIDTDGEPIGWKIVGIGKDGSVLCEKGNGQRRRYLFGDGANWKPSGEAWERLVAAAGAYTKEYGNQRMRVSEEARELMDAYAAYEAAQSAEPSGQQAMIAELQEQIRKLKVESATQTDAISEREDRIDQLNGEVQRLTAILERPEMPEVVRELLAWFVENQVSAMPIQTKLDAVRDYYAPTFKITGPGVYLDSAGEECHIVAQHGRTWLGIIGVVPRSYAEDGAAYGPVQHPLTKYLRPLEG